MRPERPRIIGHLGYFSRVRRARGAHGSSIARLVHLVLLVCTSRPRLARGLVDPDELMDAPPLGKLGRDAAIDRRLHVRRLVFDELVEHEPRVLVDHEDDVSVPHYRQD